MAGGVQSAGSRLGSFPKEGVGRVQQALRQGQDAYQGCVGVDPPVRVVTRAATAMLPDDSRVVSRQQLALSHNEGTAVLRGVAQ